MHSSSCFFSRGFVALSEDQVFSQQNPSSFSPVPGLFAGRLRLRLEWSDWSSQGARVLDSLGSFRFHFSGKGGGVPLRSSQSLRVVRRTKILVRFSINSYLWSYSHQGASSFLRFPKAVGVLISWLLLEIISFALVLILSKRTVVVD